MAKTTVVNFKGGGTLVYEKSNRNKSTSVIAGFGVGSANNTQNGIAHFAEHMLFKGTNKRTKEELEKDLSEYCGTEFNAYTAQDYTFFVFNRANVLLENALEVASDVLTNLNVLKKNVDAERSVILEEYNIDMDASKHRINEEHYTKILNRNYGAQFSVGNSEDLNNITVKNIVEFRKKFYTRENFVICAVGSESLYNVKKYVKKYFLNNLPVNEGAKKIEHPYKIVGDSFYQIVKKEVDNVLVLISLEAVASSDVMRNPALSFIEEYLTGGLDGVLFKNVRDKGLAYSISTFKDVHKDCGLFSIFFESSKQNINKVIDEISKVIKDTIKNGVPSDVVEKIRKNFNYSFSELDHKNMSKAMKYGRLIVCGEELLDDEEKRKRCNNVTKEVIDEYFSELFSKNNKIFITLGGKIKQGEVYNFEEIKSKILK